MYTVDSKCIKETKEIQNNTSDTKIKSINDYYSVTKENNNYTIILYDANKKIVHCETYYKEPYIEFIGDKVIEVSISVGSPLNYTYFYDITSCTISPVYENALLINKDKIVYMKDNILIVSNIFNKDIFYKVIKRKFSPTAVPSSAIIRAKFVSSNKLYIEYLEGKKYIKKSETIKLSK